MRNVLKLLLVALCVLSGTAHAQTVIGNGITIGPTPTPPSGTTVRLDGLATTGGTYVLLGDAASGGNIRSRLLVKADLPATTVFTDQANTFGAFAQTFGGQLLASDGTLGAPGYGFSAQAGIGMRRSAADTLQLITNSLSRVTITNATTTVTNALAASTSATVGTTLGVTGLSTLTGGFASGANSSVTGSLTVSTTLGVTGLSTLTGGFNAGAASSVAGNFTVTAANDTIVGTGGIRAGSGAVIIRNVADSSQTASFGDAAITLDRATTVNSTLNITGLTTAAKITTTGLYGVANPLTFFATDSVTPLAYFYDAGRNVVTNSGNDTVWEYHGLGNPSGSRVWRAGNIGGSYLIQSGNDAASVWTNLARSTMAAGVPNGWYWGTGVRSVNPDLDFTTDLGAYTTQYANLWIRNLWATTLVAQDVISTIGGAILVTPTTELDAAVTAGDTTFVTTHNEMVVDDIAYINDNLATEFIRVTAGPISGDGSISYVADTQAVGTSVTIPAHQVGDLIVIFAFANTGNVPALGAGFTNVAGCNASGGTTGSRVGYMIADTTTEVSGTWTNATSLMVHVYRFSGVPSTPGACAVSNAAASTSLVYPALTFSKTDHSSWVARAAIASAGTNIQTVPSGGFVLRANNTAVPETASFDSNGREAATSIAASSAITITSGNWRAITLELVSVGVGPFQYTVTRGYGGVFAARAWPGGVALANTGQVGDGGINMYAIQSIKGSGEQGPTIQGYERTSLTYNAMSTRWAVGNLRGLYNYGAVDVFGLAAGNAADVWFSAEATNGIRFFDAATTVNAHFALDGSILLGQTGAGQSNTRIDASSVRLRYGVVDQVRVTASGIQMFDTAGTERVLLNTTALTMGRTGAGQPNAYLSDTELLMRLGGTNYMAISASGVQGFDSSAVRRLLIDPSGYALFGRTGAGNRNVYVGDSSVNIRENTTNRLLLDTNGIALNDSAGTNRVLINATDAYFGAIGGARLQLNYSASTLQMYDSTAKLYFQVNATGGLYLGDWYTANAASLQISATEAKFCRAGVNCPLVFNGATGDITSIGSIFLTSGGNISSTGNFSLTAAGGLSFSASGSSAGDAAKRISFPGTSYLYEYSNTLHLKGGSGSAGYSPGGTTTQHIWMGGSVAISGDSVIIGDSNVGTVVLSAYKSGTNHVNRTAQLGVSGALAWSEFYFQAPAGIGGVNQPDGGFLVLGSNNRIEKYTTGLDMDMQYDYTDFSGPLICTIRIRNGIVTEFLGCV